MKKLTTILLMAGAILSALPSCKSSNDYGPPLNATMQQLIGTWKLKKASGIIPGFTTDTTYTGYDSTYYLNFSSVSYDIHTKERNLYGILPTFVPYICCVPSTNVSWYATSPNLFIDGNQYTIITLSSSQFVFSTTPPSSIDTFYYAK